MRNRRPFRVQFRGDFLQPSRDRVSRQWKRAGWRYAKRLARFASFGPGALVVAGLSNLFAKVPRLDTRPPVSGGTPMSTLSYDPRGRKRGRSRSRSTARSGAVGRAVQRNQDEDPSTYVQYTLSKRTLGRPISRFAKMQKLVSSITQSLILRWQNINSNTTGLDAVEGQFKLNYSLGASGGQSLYPYYLFDLCSLPNVSARSSGTLTWKCPAVCMRLVRNRQDVTPTDANNNYDFITLPGSANGAAPYSWQYEQKPGRAVPPMLSTYLDWVDMRLQVFGAKQKPSRVTVQLIQFTDENMCPRNWWQNDQTSTPTYTEDDPSSVGAAAIDNCKKWNEQWIGEVDTLVSCPIQKRDHLSLSRPYRVLYSESVDINPTQTTESDTRGHIKGIKLFKRMNKYLDLNWESQGGVSPGGGIQGLLPVNEANPNYFDAARPDLTDLATANECQPCPRKGARVFLLVKGVSAVAGAFDNNSHASFDILLRKRHTVVGNT